MRFVPIDERSFTSIHHSFPPNYVGIMNKSKREKLSWKSLALVKDPMTLITYQQLFQEVKPKTILEFGTFEGGSALWMDDILKSLGIQSKIYTFDINNDNISINSTNITTITWDVYDVKNYVKNNLKFFKSLEHPIVVIDDCHCNLDELFSEIDNFLIPGEYIIVEDTLKQEYYKQMVKFLDHKNYLVDTHYCDFWGLNHSWNVNSYLIKQ